MRISKASKFTYKQFLKTHQPLEILFCLLILCTFKLILPLVLIFSEVFVGEETFITSGISSIRNRIYYVYLGKSLSFLFHFTAVYLLQGLLHFGCCSTSPPVQEVWSNSFCRFGKKSPACAKDRMLGGFFFFICRSSTRLQTLHPNFLSFGIVHVWPIYKNNHTLQNHTSILLP